MDVQRQPANTVLDELDTHQLGLALAAVTRMDAIWHADVIARMRADIRDHAQLQRARRDRSFTCRQGAVLKG